jgi:hypothetical protein
MATKTKSNLVVQIYQKLQRCNSDKKGDNFAKNWPEWSTEANIKQMYNTILLEYA